MKYCILIEITRDTISFLYNKDNGENRFTPCTEESVMPLAVLCEGDRLVVGDYALKEARRGNKNAFDRLFNTIQQRRNISYRGNDYDINKLLLLVIEKYISDFFERVLLRSQGSIEDNRNALPLLISFGNDLKENERTFVRSLLTDNGYGHVEVVDSNALLLEVLYNNKVRPRAYLFVGRSDNDLYCRLRTGGNYTKEFRLEGVANDPRVAKAEKKIWEDICQRDYYPSPEEKKRDKQIVHDRAKSFVQSGKAELEGTITLSNNREYDYFLEARSLNSGGRRTLPEAWIRGESIIEEALNSCDLSPNDCHVVLADKDAATDYIKSLFVDKFSTTLLSTDLNREQVRELLLKDVKRRGYQVGTSGDIATPPPTITGSASSSQQTRDVQKVGSLFTYSEETSTTTLQENAQQEQKPDAEAHDLFISGKFKEAREAYRSLDATSFAAEIKQCIECTKNEKELPHVVETERRKILERWKKLGIKREVIARHLSALTPATSSATTPVRKPQRSAPISITIRRPTPHVASHPAPATTPPVRRTTTPQKVTPTPTTVKKQTSQAPLSAPTITPREFRVKFAEYKAMVRTKSDEKKGREGLLRLRDELHRAGNHDFDDKFKEAFHELHIKQ